MLGQPLKILMLCLILENPYTPGVPEESLARIKRIFTAPREFSLRNVFYDQNTIRPVIG
jgi:hypothetical protein